MELASGVKIPHYEIVYLAMKWRPDIKGMKFEDKTMVAMDKYVEVKLSPTETRLMETKEIIQRAKDGDEKYIKFMRIHWRVGRWMHRGRRII